MENSPAKQQRIGTPTKMLLAGVFLVAAFMLPMAFRAETISIPSAPGGAPAAQSFVGGITAAIEHAVTGNNDSQGGGVAAGTGIATANAQATPASSSNLPVKLVIPSLGISSGIQYVGLTADGNMDTPKSAVDVAWYKLGPKPGDVGNAVIAGHINTRYSAHGVFEHLEDLAAGDTVSVVTKGGDTLKFRVTGKKFLPYDAPSSEVFGTSSGRHLNLITCAGTWQADKHVYDKRLVIFTELVQ
jgi:LPXTG-site transpeptidase (sortase) family protein